MQTVLTQQEFDFIFANKGKMTQTEIAKAINKSNATVSVYINSKDPKPPKAHGLTQLEIDFIIENKDKMRQNKIASHLGVTPPCVNKIIRSIKQGKLVKMKGYFDIEDFAKQYAR